jgi:hypothetical protein
MNTEQRIAALEAELAALKTKAARTTPTSDDVAPRSSAFTDGPRVVLIEERTTFVRPTQNEFGKLCDIVLAKYPQLRPRLSSQWADQEKQECFDGFEWSFERLGYIGRRRYVNHWVEETKDWLRLHRPAHRGNIGAGFLAAVLAHGDICFTPGDANRGVV